MWGGENPSADQFEGRKSRRDDENAHGDTSAPTELPAAQTGRTPWDDAMTFIIVLVIIIVLIVILVTMIIIRLERTKPEQISSSRKSRVEKQRPISSKPKQRTDAHGRASSTGRRRRPSTSSSNSSGINVVHESR